MFCKVAIHFFVTLHRDENGLGRCYASRTGEAVIECNFSFLQLLAFAGRCDIRADLIVRIGSMVYSDLGLEAEDHSKHTHYNLSGGYRSLRLLTLAASQPAPLCILLALCILETGQGSH